MYVGWKGGWGAEWGLMRAFVKELQRATHSSSRKEEGDMLFAHMRTSRASLITPLLSLVKTGFPLGISVTFYDTWGLELTLWVYLGLFLKFIAPGLLFITLYVITLGHPPNLLSGPQFPPIKASARDENSSRSDTSVSHVLISPRWTFYFLECCA